MTVWTSPNESPLPASESAEARFRRLYEAYYPSLLAFAKRRVRDGADAHDVVADAFLVLWRRLSDAPSDDHDVLLWLYGVARRVIANRQRSATRRERLAARLAHAAVGRGDAADAATIRSDAHGVFAALKKLSDDDREILLLAAWECLSTSDIARVLDCTENAAAIRLHRARKRLTDVYQKEYVPHGDG